MSTLIQSWLSRPASTATGLHSGDDPSDLRFRTWNEVRSDAQRAAAGLAAAGIGHGDSVALLVGDPGDVATLVQAVWLRGAAFTMLHQPTPRTDLATWLDETRAVIEMLDAAAVIVGDPFTAALDQNTDLGAPIVTVADLDGDHPAVDATPIDADDLAILQLTSGSTGAPKAVAITFGNVEANQHAMVGGVQATDSDVAISWLPLFHDMGMIGLLVLPMLRDITTVITTPTAFLRKPQVWVELITRFGGTCTAAPNFAYAVLAKRLRRAPDGAFDLSSMRVFLNGAEPIDENSLNLFLDEAARFGLKPEAMLPSYGMAEATLAVSFDHLDRPPSVDRLDAAAAESTRTAVRTENDDARPHVRLGVPVDGLELRVVDDQGDELPADRIGGIHIRGAAVTARYLKPEGFVDAVDENGWLDTGDLGYLTPDGEVVVVGRTKDVIIVSGRNISPTVIERAAADVAGVRTGNVAAVSYPRPDGREGIAVVAESELHDHADESQRIHDEITRSVFDAVGVPVSAVTLIGKGELPKTTSGKIRRHSAAGLVTAGASS